jgi:ribosomal protein S18 acetylase RimI-like enzyme
MREVRASGADYLALVTRLLQRARLADDDAGLWEAADLQWWWRMPRRSDELEQVFWVDDDGPVAAFVLTEWRTAWGCDPIVVPGAGVSMSSVWARAVDAIDALELDTVDVLVRDDDRELTELARGSGFVAGETSGTTWMRAEDRSSVVPPPEGFTLTDRPRATGPHPLRRRNGDRVEERLRECSLYDPELDLAVVTDEGEHAGYALFWLDPVTEVGLVEPMRVEDAYQRRGLARALLTEGLERLAARGARRLKVGYATEPARALYEGAGFETTTTTTTYRRGRVRTPV